ncbi:hypothetical protein B0H13DRAFT_1855085 [Mycena leptocephala]|nr:hypothetical protein B0H13DRAFT_1855085 [Mycena leptocephala]
MAVSSSESIIWVDCEGEDEDFIEIVESIQPSRESVVRQPPSGPSSTTSRPSGTRRRSQSPDSDIEIIDTPPSKRQRSGPDCEGETPDDYAIALALQKQWEEEDGVARKRAAEDEERSQQLIARLQAMDEKMDKKRRIAPQKRRKGGQDNAVPEDGIVFKVVVDADGNTLEGDPDPDNVAHLELVKRVFEEPGPDMLGVGTQRLKVKTGSWPESVERQRHSTLVSVTWFVNVKLEARFEAAKELLASLGIDNSETNLFHGTAANNIQPILEGGFLIPGVSSDGKMVNGKTEGYGIYLAPTASASIGYARGINKMFMCRVVTGRVSNEISHAKPRPLGQNGYESCYGTGASVGHFYVVKHIELVLPRYVVEFDMPVPPFFNPFNFAPAIGPLAFAPPLPPLIPPRCFGVGKVSAIKRGAAENQDVKVSTGKGKARVKEENPN